MPNSAPGGPEDEPNDDETCLKQIKTFSRVLSIIPPFINSPTVGASVGASVNPMYCSRCMMVSCFPCTLLLSFWVLFVIPSCSPFVVPRGGGV